MDKAGNQVRSTGQDLNAMVHRQLFLLWLLAGSAAILVSVYYATPPYETGTGASQATTALFAASLLVIFRLLPYGRYFPLVTTLIGLSIFGLDLLHSGLPKPGHIAAFAAGSILTLVFLPSSADGVGKSANSSAMEKR